MAALPSVRSAGMTGDREVFSEDDLLPVSALQHLVFCERQAALIHVEGVWRDNALTMEGARLHRRVDEEAPRKEVRGDVVILRGLALRSLKLGLIGRADVVELHRFPKGEAPPSGSSGLVSAGRVPGLTGCWAPFPVDYKRGKPKPDRCDAVQLCAQALCLEEMLGIQVTGGALFYGRRQRRQPVPFDDALRAETARAAARLHRLLSEGETPAAKKTAKCRRCSLLDLCLPKASNRPSSARGYLSGALSTMLAQDEADRA